MNHLTCMDIKRLTQILKFKIYIVRNIRSTLMNIDLRK